MPLGSSSAAPVITPGPTCASGCAARRRLILLKVSMQLAPGHSTYSAELRPATSRTNQLRLQPDGTHRLLPRCHSYSRLGEADRLPARHAKVISALEGPPERHG